jgi:sugar O-acyltransferase (sialic acid O-acetyltransferase NeuD family)
MTIPLVLVGGGGHCRSVIDVIESQHEFSIHGIVDDRLSGDVLGYPILGRDAILPEIFSKTSYALVTVGQIRSSTIRAKLYEHLLRLGYELPAISSKTAKLSKHAMVGSGSIVMHGAIITAGSKIGPNVIINNKVLIDHDCVIGSHCHISTGVILNGGVEVGENCFIGSGSVVREGVQIGAGSFVAMGSVITKDIDPNTILRG